MKLGYGENPQTRGAGIEPFANRRAAGVGRKKRLADPLNCTPAEKSVPGFVDASIHRLPCLQVNLRGSEASSLRKRSS